jgi:catechol-2,3-dioxygenase
VSARVRLGHVAVPAQNPKELATFYSALLGLDVTLEGTLPNLGDFVFLSDHPAEQQQTLTFMTRPEAKHIAWEVESLAALKALYAAAQAKGIHLRFALNHRVTLSLYLSDPEGNSIEIFWPTGQAVDGLYAEPFDPALLEQPDADLLALVNGSAAQ